MARSFRFGYQYGFDPAADLRDLARRAEAAGFDLVCSWDHVTEGWTPLLPLLAVEGLTVEDALVTPFLALGTHDEIAEHLLACRERWGITNYTVRSIEDVAPVIASLRSGATIGT